MYHQEQKVSVQQKVRISTEPLDPGMKKKPGTRQLQSERQKTKVSGKEESDLSQRESVASQTPGSSFITAEEQQKLMVLSGQARQALIEMQRFDRFIYVMESQKRLKGPIEKELKRLEKIKNSGNKSMKSTYFDNELTITCLFNHMKNMYQMNRDLGEIVVLKAEIQSLQQKIIELNMKYNKDIKEASNTARGKFAQESEQLKQTLKFHQNIISALKQVNLDRSKKKIEAEIKKYTEDKKEMLELISNLISKANTQASAAIIDTFTVTLDKIIQDQGDVNKNVAYLEKEKKAIEKLINDPRADEGKKRVLEQLLDTIHYIISIYGLAKSGGGGQNIKIQSSLTETSLPNNQKALRELQQKWKLLQQQGNNWITEFETLTKRLESDENITTDLNKHRKLLGVKKNMDPTISKYTQLVLNILEFFNKKIREQNLSSNADKDKSTQIEKLTKTNIVLQKQIQQLRDQISKASKQSQKQPSAEAQWAKLINMINQAFNKREQNEPTAQGQINKIKKYIDLNRKKFPTQFHPLLDIIDYLIRLVIQGDGAIKQIEQQQLRKQQAQGKDITNLQSFSAALEKLLTSGDAFNDGYLNKLKKNLQTTFGKLEKLEQTPLLNLYLGSLDNTWKILEMLERTHQSTKGKDEEIKKQDYEALRDQLKNKQQELKTKEQELKTSRQQFTNSDKKIKQYERRIEEFEKAAGEKKSQVEDQKKEKLKNQQSDKQVKGFQKEIQRLQKQIERMKRQNESLSKDKQTVVIQYEKEVKKLTNELQNSSNIKDLERQNNELKRSVENLNRSVNDGKTKQVERLRREVEQLKNIQTAQQQSINLKNEEIENFKRKVKELEKSKQQIKFVESRVESRESEQGSAYWRERYQASKLENQVLRDQLAALERRFDEVYVNTTHFLTPQSHVKSQQADIELNRIKASLAKQQAIVLSQSLQIDRYRIQESENKNQIQNLNQQLRAAQVSIGSLTKSASVEKQTSQLIAQNTRLQNEIIEVKSELNTTIGHLIFVDGQNFRINEDFKKAEERCKVLESNISSLENSIKSGIQVSKLRDQNIQLQNKYEELRREMDIAVSELQSYKQKPTRGSGSMKIHGTPKPDKVGSSEWTTSQQVFIKDQTLTQTKSQTSFNNSQKNKEMDILAEKVTRLENEKRSLTQRLGLLQVYSGQMAGANQTFIDNVNKLIENTIRFMIDFEGVSEDLLIDSSYIVSIRKCLKKKDFAKYFELSQEYLRNAINALLIHKNTGSRSTHVETHQVESQQIIIHKTVITSEGSSGLNAGSLENLFKLYLKGKDPQLLGEIKDILSIRQ